MGRDKATLTVPPPFGGRTFVERLVDVLGRRCTPIFVVAAAGQSLPELSATVLRDEIPDLGPLPAVGLGLAAAAAAGARWAFVCAVDMPYLTVEVLDAVTARTAGTAAELVLPFDGRDHYLCGAYRTGLADRITALTAAGERRMGALAERVDTLRVAVTDSGALANVNTPDDLR